MVLKILVDWDSTLNQFDESLIRSINDKFGTTYEVSDIGYWGWLGDGMPKDQVGYVWKDLFRDYRWNMEVPPQPGAVLGFNRLIDAGHDVHVVTSRFGYMKPWVSEWLEKWGFTTPYTVATMPKKGVYVVRNRVNIGIDDAPHNAIDMAEVLGGENVYLIDSPWNRDENDDFWGWHRTKSVWTAVEDILS